jgi:hypothetical protein
VNPQADHHSRLVTLLKLFIQASDISVLTLCLKLMNFLFQIFHLFGREIALEPVSLLIFFIFSPFAWLGFCNYCNLAFFLEHSSYQTMFYVITTNNNLSYLWLNLSYSL